MIELEFCELHGPIFVKGTNLPPKLVVGDAPGQRRDIKLFYDRSHREVHVHFKDKIAIVPRENVASMVEKTADIPTFKGLAESLDRTANTVMEKMTAQVDTPQNHVFAGPGKGKTGRDK